MKKRNIVICLCSVIAMFGILLSLIPLFTFA